MVPFGEFEGKEVYLSHLENEYIEAEVFSFGASLRSFREKSTGKDIVLGFDTFEPYTRLEGSCLGATVGRCANRIGLGKFRLNGKEYSLAVNNGPNCLHGGLVNYSQRVFEVIADNSQTVKYRYLSPDGEEGFPGNLQLTVTYQLAGPVLNYIIEAECDQDTVLNITNHSYFNLEAGEGRSIAGQKMQIFSDKVALADENGMASPEVLDVRGTAFDYLEPHPIGDALRDPHPNMRLTNGIDHNYLFEENEETVTKMAVLTSEDLVLTVGSDLPGLQVYTANFLNLPDPGKYGYFYTPYSAVCFEGQYYPNAINYDFCQKPILRKDRQISHRITYALTKRSAS